jgi:tRNA-intron endonuclease, archaea type
MPRKKVFKAKFLNKRIIIDDKNSACDLFSKGSYGNLGEDKVLTLSIIEGLYLLEKGWIEIKKGLRKVKPETLLKFAKDEEANFWVRYCVYKDMRDRGYILKTALKFGADFRVYSRGVKPGEDHAKWILYPVHESDKLTWHDFAAKNRVAHSTKKRLNIAIVDDEGDITYYECKWTKP